MGGERRKKEGEGGREGRKGTEEGPTKNSCRGAQNVKLRHCRYAVAVVAAVAVAVAVAGRGKLKNVR